MAEKAPTLAELEGVVEEDTGPESVADSLREAMAEASNAQDEAADSADTRAADESAAGRARDASGRFKAAGEEGKPAAKAEDGNEAEPEPGKPVAAQEPEPLEPRPEWTLEEQKAFRELPAPAQKMLMERVSAVDKKAGEVEQRAQRYQRLDVVLKEQRESLAKKGLDEATAVHNLFVLADLADAKPLEFIQWLAKDRGIDLAQVFAGKPAAADDGTADPVVAELRGEIATLKKQINGFEGTVQSREQQERTAYLGRIEQNITTFAGETDEKGAAKYPYFQTVRPLMASLISSGEAPDLKTAYDMACRAKPDVWAKIDAANQAKADREAAQKRREKAAAAGRAGSSISGSPGARSEPQSTGDLREDLRAAFSERGFSATSVI